MQDEYIYSIIIGKREWLVFFEFLSGYTVFISMYRFFTINKIHALKKYFC